MLGDHGVGGDFVGLYIGLEEHVKVPGAVWNGVMLNIGLLESGGSFMDCDLFVGMWWCWS